MTPDSLKNNLKDPYWRLNNLYYIKDKSGKKVRFKLNWAQKIFYKQMWFLNLILKARQLGMTTFIQIFMLDRCVFNSNINAGVIAHNRDDAHKFFKDKIKYAYDNLPASIKQKVKATNDSVGELAFSNGSAIRVGTSLRSGTYQYLHISEYGKLCAKFPEKAEEVKTGALNTVAAGQFVFIESTAEGDHGAFHDLCMQYRDYPVDKLTKLDYKFFFFSWFDHPEYELETVVDIPLDAEKYFDDVEQKIGIKLSPEKKYWYVKKKITQGSKMKQEYPSTPDEAFERISEYAVYGKEIGRIIKEDRRVSLPLTSKPVHLFFDIGKSRKIESTCVWFMQHNDPWYDFVDYYQSSLKLVSDYVAEIKAKGYNLGKWHIPHDGSNQYDHSLKTFKMRLINAGVPEKDIVIVDKIDFLKTGIDMTKEKLASCRFDDQKTKDGFKALKAYHYEWDEKRGVLGEPAHDWSSHPSDAFRQFPQGYSSYDVDDSVTMGVNSYWG